MKAKLVIACSHGLEGKHNHQVDSMLYDSPTSYIIPSSSPLLFSSLVLLT